MCEEKIVPTEWHHKPRSKHGCVCPHCGAPGKIEGAHRMIPGTDGDPPRYGRFRRVGGEWVEVVYKRPSRDGVGKGVGHRYPNQTRRPPMMAKVRQRIIDATQLLAIGMTYREIAERLGVRESTLFCNQTDHKTYWEMCLAEASKATADALKQLAGTPDIFRNNGKLIRMAVTQQQDTASPFPSDAGDGSQTITAFLEDVYLPSRIGVCAQHLARLRSTVKRLVAFLGHDVAIGELNEADLCRFLTAFRQTQGAVTTNHTRQALLTLWNNAYDYNLCPRPPRRGLVRRVPEEVDPPEAWTSPQVDALMSRAAIEPGTIEGIPAGNWWSSLLLSIYWSSCRISAMIQTPVDCYRPGEGILVRKQKNHRPQWFPLPASCCAAIDATRPSGRNSLWPWPWHQRKLWTDFRRIIEAAGLPCPRTGRQLFHRLRRTTITLCASVDPAVAQRTAGHRDYATTLRHYIDPRLVRQRSAADVMPEPVITHV